MPQTVNGGRIQFGVGFKTDTSGLKQLENSLLKLQTTKLGDFNGTRQQLNEVRKTVETVREALQKAFNTDLGSLNISKFNQELKGLNIDKIYQDFSKFGIAGQTAFSQVSSQILNTNLKLKETKSIVDSLGQTFMNSIKWNIASSVINSFTGSLQQAFGYVKNLDSSLTNIRIVTGDSREQMAAFAVEANNAAAALGKTTRDYTDAALSFYQQGLNDEEVKVRTEASLKAQNITQGQASVDELTAVWNGYQVSVAETQKYVDKLAAVADNSASDMSQLATAMSKVAATANVMGVDIDQLTAQIATIVATTRQAPQTVGNALKTIYARINDIKAGTDDAETSLGNYSSKMAALGFSVLDANGNLRQTGQVMEEIGERWTTLTKEQQVYLAQTMAGQRQYNQLISLFDNWTQYSEMLNVSLESEGTLNEKNARYMESLAAHIEQFTAARQNLMDSLLNADSMREFVDLGTGIVNILAKIVDVAGGGGTAILAIGSALTTLFSKQIGAEINNLIINFQNIQHNAELVAQKVNSIELFGKSQGMKNEAVAAMVKAQGEIMQYSSALTAQQKNQYDELVKQLGEQQNLLTIEEDKATKAEAFQQQLEKQNRTQEDLLNLLDKVSGKLSTLDSISKRSSEQGISNKETVRIKELIQEVIQLNQITGNNSEKAQNFALAWEDVASKADFTADEISILKRQIQEFYQTAHAQEDNLSYHLEDEGHKAQILREQIKQTEKQVEQFQRQAAQAWNVQNIVSMIGAVGQLASVVMAVSNTFKILTDDSKTFGQKIQAIGAVLAFTLPQVLNIYQRTFGELIKAGTAQLQVEKLKELQILRQNQLILEEEATEKRKTVELKKQTAELLKQQAIKARESADNLQVFPTGISRDKKTGKIVSKQETQSILNGADAADQALDRALIDVDLAENAADMAQDAAKVAGDAVEDAAGKSVSAFDGLKTSLSTFGTKFAALMSPPTGLIIAGLVAAAAAAYGFYKWWNKDAEAAEKAAQAAKQANEHYKELKDTFNEFNNSISTYDDAVDALNKLNKGTEEWNQKLKETNEQVLQLLDKYPQLAEAISQNADGLLTIDKNSEAYKSYLDDLNRQTQVANVARLGTQQKSNEADRTSQITNLSRSTGINRSDLNKVINAMQHQGNAIIGDTKKLEDILGVGSPSIKAIQDNADKITSLATTIENNTKATEILGTTIAQDLLKDNKTYENSDYQSQFSDQVSNRLQNAEFNQTAYSYRDMQTGALQDDTKAIADRYAEILGQQVKKNFWGSGYSVKDAVTGEWEKVTADFVKNEIAAADAMDNLDEIIQQTDQVIKQITNTYERQSEVAAALQFQNVKSADDVENIDLTKMSYNDVNALDVDFLASLYSWDDETVEAVKNKLEQSKDQTRQIAKQYADTLDIGVKEAFNQIDSDKMSGQMQTQVAGILKKVFVAGEGISGFEKQVAESLQSAIDADKLEELLSQNWDQINLDQATDIFKKLGIEVPKSKEALQAFINALKTSVQELSSQQIYNNVHSVIDKKNGKTLNFLDQIDADAYQKLVDAGVAVDNAFVKLTDGTYKFVGDAEEFYKQANQTSLQPFLDEIDRLRRQVEKGATVNYESLSGNTIDTTNHTVDRDKAQNQIDALKTIGALTEEQYANYNNLINTPGAPINKLAPALEQISEAIEKNREKLENYQDTANQVLIDQQRSVAFSQQDLGQLSHLRNSKKLNQWLQSENGIKEYTQAILAASQAEGIETKNVKYLASMFEEEAKNLDWVNNNLEGNAQASMQVAAYLEDLVSGVQNLQKAWKESIKEGIDLDDIDPSVLAETQEILSDMFNQDVGEGFLANRQNLEIIQELAKGNIQAFEDLTIAMGRYVAQANMSNDIDLGVNINTQQFYARLDEIDSLLATYNPTIDVGTSIDDTPYYDAINEMVNNAGWAQEEVEKYLEGINYTPDVVPIDVPLDTGQYNEDTKTYHFDYVDPVTKERIVADVDENLYSQYKNAGKITLFSIRGSKFKGGTNALTKAGGSRVTPKAPSGGGGGKKGGGGNKGSSKKAKTEKPKQVKTDPYHKINRQLDDQQRKLKKLDDLEDRLIPRDRLAVLEKESNQYQKQIKLLKEKEDIADSELARLKTALTGQNASNVKVQFQANGQIANYNEVLKGAYDKYNQWVTNVYNKMTAEQQQAAASQKQSREQALKQLEDNLQEYEKTLDLIDDIEDALQAANKAQAALFLTALKYRMQIREAAGDLQRQFQDFSDKVINDLADEDYLAQVQSKFDKIMSYVNSKELEERKTQIDILRQELDNINKGIESKYSAAEVQSMLDDLLKQQMSDLQEIKDLQKEIQQQFIDALDNAKDKQDQVMDQYGRINDQIQRGIDLTNKLYGDKAYEMLDKYYEKQNANNLRELQTLKQQENYWRAIMSSQQLGSQAWKAARENLESVVDAFGDKLEQALDNLATWWENQVDLLVDNLNNKLTGGMGTEYLDFEWDQMSRIDDDFLDAVNRSFSTNEIRDMYQEGLDALADSPAAQAKLNKLMKQQMKILEEKEDLTQYDIDRAKALYDIEMKRFELEEMRNSKTTMRLRRDSQGNYTYQYVEDEEKVSDLQKALSEAENNLYNMDKQHYKETLQNMYDVYKEYQEKRTAVNDQLIKAEQELRDAETQEAKAAAQKKIEALQKYAEEIDDTYTKLFEMYQKDAEWNKGYVGRSAAAVLGLQGLTDDDRQKLVDTLVPYATSSIAALQEAIAGQGGFMEAVIKPLTAGLEQAGQKLLDGIAEAKSMYDENAEVREAENEFFLQFDVQQMNKAAEQVSAVSNTLKAIDEWLKATFTQEFIDNIVNGVNQVQESNVMKDEDSEEMGLGAQGNTKLIPLQTDTSSFNGASAILPMSVTNAEDDTARVDYWKALLDTQELGTDAYAAALANYEGALQTAAINKLVSSLADYYQDPQRYLSQAVTINADFPNVESWQEIVEAIRNLTLTASQQSSSTIRTAG